MRGGPPDRWAIYLGGSKRGGDSFKKVPHCRVDTPSPVVKNRGVIRGVLGRNERGFTHLGGTGSNAHWGGECARNKRAGSEKLSAVEERNLIP